MEFCADYHTHTKYSHGKGKIIDNVRVASEKGFKEIAITDHGFNQFVMGLCRKDIPKMRKEIDTVQKEFNDTKILMGVEANFIGRDGQIDIKENEFGWFDIIVCGFHKVVWGATCKDFFSMILKNLFAAKMNINISEKERQKNTQTYINAIKKNPIDIISHINHDMIVDPVEVAKVCRDYGTYIEISSRKEHLSCEQWQKVVETGVNFVVDSDAHKPENVGNMELALKAIKTANIPLDRIHNIGRLPQFRSQQNR